MRLAKWLLGTVDGSGLAFFFISTRDTMSD